MNRITCFLLAAALLPAAQPLMAQRAGVIAYEVTAKTDPERMRFFQRGGDGGEAPEMPDVITFNQTFTFSNNNGKLTTQRPEMPGFTRTRPGADTSNIRRGGAFAGRNNTQYIDLEHKKYLLVFSTFGDDKKTYYTEEDFIITPDKNPSSKTKKIAGYTCKKATVQLKDDTYTVWYTTDLPFSFSPINGLLPDSNAVVLAAEGSKRGFTAKSVNLQAVNDTELTLPADAQKISPEEMRNIRRQEMEKFRQRQPQN
ncbi:GLPGLI family protein [Chitinophaga vietnamensis]|uniref:GLPGLI family protein n=1 Tax=Chitinophaga vietnamensis TaxID=2593957 RepID=UPI001178C762|nr:GLPGLI family protein [Chitinophaga vietnamensis]